MAGRSASWWGRIYLFTPTPNEAGGTEPIQPLFNPMLVDIVPDEQSDNYYFYQAKEGGIVFCITPRPKRMGTDRRSTSEFLPMVIPRMLNLYPRLRNIRVRRVWRGLYPMTLDGVPIVGFDRDVEGFFHAVGYVRPRAHARPRPSGVRSCGHCGWPGFRDLC